MNTAPAGWKLSPLKRVANFHTGWTPPTERKDLFDGDNFWANISDLGPRLISATRHCISDKAVQLGRIPLSPRGSVLFSFKLSVGQVSFADRDMYTNEAIASFPPQHNVCMRWLYWALPVFVPRNAKENIYGAALLNQQLIRDAELWVPPLSTQTAIADYLDRKTAAIDALIAKKELLIEELRKYQEAVIAEAVAPREGWSRLRLKQCVRTKISTGVGEPGTEFVEGDPRYVRTTDIASLFTLKDSNIRTLPRSVAGEAPVQSGDILFTTAGSVGKTYVHLEQGEFCYAGFLAKISLSAAHCPKFFGYLLSSSWVQDLVTQFKVTSTIDNFSASKLGELGVCVPPLEVQVAISDALGQNLAASCAALEKGALSLAALREFRAALISEAVTGKISV